MFGEVAVRHRHNDVSVCIKRSEEKRRRRKAGAKEERIPGGDYIYTHLLFSSKNLLPLVPHSSPSTSGNTVDVGVNARSSTFAGKRVEYVFSPINAGCPMLSDMYLCKGHYQLSTQIERAHKS
jgi:hypothetical protein